MAAEYHLRKGVYLVKGASRGAILDTNSGRVYSVNRQACDVCSYLMEDEPFWNQLALLGLAEPAEGQNLTGSSTACSTRPIEIHLA